jgi:hypothetical protein
MDKGGRVGRLDVFDQIIVLHEFQETAISLGYLFNIQFEDLGDFLQIPGLIFVGSVVDARRDDTQTVLASKDDLLTLILALQMFHLTQLVKVRLGGVCHDLNDIVLLTDAVNHIQDLFPGSFIVIEMIPIGQPLNFIGMVSNHSGAQRTV